jgi:exo-poly-alpha-galacturonosidase
MENQSHPISLLSPPEAQTETTIALVWDKPKDASDITAYQIYCNENVYGICTETDYTAENLTPSQEYTFYVRAVLKSGTLSPKSNTITVSTKKQADVFDITAFGAVGDGSTCNTKSIQAAIDACTPGGKVYVPSGVFITGALYLKSNMTLYIDKGGILLGSSDLAEYPILQYRFEGLETACYASLINTKPTNGERLEHITIEGLGKIDANGAVLRQKELADGKGKPGRAVCIRNVDSLYLYGITVKQSPAWCVHLIYCNHVSVNQIKIYTKQDEDGTRYQDICNGDGLDPDSSSDMYIFHSTIASQDDCIAIKSGRDEEGRRLAIPSENIRITNCRFESGFGVAMGSEMSGGVRNVLVQDCTFCNVYSVGSVKTPRGRGGVVENIVYDNLTLQNYSREHCDCKWFRGAIYVDQFYSHDTFDLEHAQPFNESTPVIRDITFRNIVLDTVTGNAVYLSGLPESPLEHITLENITAIGKYGLKANNIKGFAMENVSILSREDENYVLNHIEP